VKTAVNRTTEPGWAVDTSELLVIVSTDTGTVAVQGGSPLPAAQLLPVVAEVIVGGQDLVTGVGVVHRDRERHGRGRADRQVPGPGQFGLAKLTLPVVATASPL